MTRISKKSIDSLLHWAAFVLVAPINPLSVVELLPSVGWAQEAIYAEPVAIARMSAQRRHARPIAGVKSIPVVPEDPAPRGVMAEALAPCNSGSGENLTLPGKKGDVKLDPCYRGRDQLVCSLRTLSSQAKAIIQDFTTIVEANYPDVRSVESICGIKLEDVAAHLEKASVFGARFKELRKEYDSRIDCAGRVERSLREVSLADMPRGEDILKSMNDALQTDLKDVAVTRQTIGDFAVKMDSSQKAMAVIQKIHRAMCFEKAEEEPSGAVQEKPATAQPAVPMQPVTQRNK